MVFACASFAAVQANEPQRARTSSMSGTELGRMSAIDVTLVARIEPRFADLGGMRREEALQQDACDHHANQEQNQEQVPRCPAGPVEFAIERSGDADENRRAAADRIISPAR